MAVWNEIETGFNPAEETIIFGARNYIESDGEIHESITRATISTNLKINQSPCVRALSHDSGAVFIAIDMSLIVFENETCNCVHFVAEFSSIIDCFTVSSDGKFVFVTTREEGLYCFNLETKVKLFNKVIKTSTGQMINFVDIFLLNEHNSVELLIVGSHYEIFRIYSLDLKSISESVHSQNMEDDKFLAELVDKIQVDNYSNYVPQSIENEILSAEVICNKQLYLCGEHLCKWSHDEDQMSFKTKDRIRKIKSLKYFGFLIGVTVNDEMVAICPISLTLLPLMKDSKVYDFEVVEGNSEKDETIIIILTKDECKNEHVIQVATLPGFDIKYSILVAETSFLVSLSEKTQDIFYIEGVKNSNNKYVQQMKVKILMQVLPQERLEHLLRRGMFPAAKQFAEEYGLDKEKIYKAQAAMISQKTGSDNDILLEVLDQIKDVKFVVECCSKALTNDLFQTRKLFEYSYKRLKLENLNDCSQSLVADINNILLRLDTFKILFNSDETTFDLWLSFSNANLLNAFQRYVEEGDLMKATIIWNRHLRAFSDELTASVINSTLRSIPCQVDLEQLCLFIRFFVPKVLVIEPVVLDLIIEWALEEVRYLELDKPNWPENGLDFLEEIRLAFTSEINVISMGLFIQNSMPCTVYQKLISLFGDLQDLQQLKKDFKIRLTLEEYLQPEKNKVVISILNKTAAQDIQLLVSSFLKIFLRRNGIDLDNILKEYIQRLCYSSINHYLTTPWESTITTVISCIHNIQHRMECTVLALQIAPVPWSKEITQLAENSLKLEHPLVSEIRFQMKNVTIKLIYKKYGFISPLLSGKVNIDEMIVYIHNIIKQNKPDMMTDVIQIAETSHKLQTETYILIINHLVEKELLHEAITVLKTLDIEFICKLCNNIVYKIDHLLQFNFLSDLCLNYINFLDLICSIHNNDMIIIDIPIEELRCIYFLRIEFGVHITLNQYSSRIKRENIMKDFVMKIFHFDSKWNTENNKNKLGRIASLLQLPTEEGLLVSAIKAIDESKFMEAELFTGFLSDCDILSNDVWDKFYYFSESLIYKSDIPNNCEIFTAASDICSRICVTCSSDVIAKWLVLYEWLKLISCLSIGCGNVDPILKWSFSPLYYDQIYDGTTVQKFVMDVYKFRQLNWSSTYIEFQPEVLDLLSEYNKKFKEDMIELTFLEVLLQVYYSAMLSESEILKEIYEQIKPCVLKLFHRLVSSSKLCETLGIAILLSMKKEDCLKMLENALKLYSHDCLKLYSVSSLAVLYSNLYHTYDILPLFTASLMRCKWAKKLMKLGIPYKEAFKENFNCHKTFEKLLSVKSINIELVQEFCFDFEVSTEDYLCLYLKSIILSWKPELEITTSFEGKKEVKIKNSEDNIYQKCQQIISKLNNAQKIYESFNSVYSKINYYHYEMYMCVARLMKDVDLQHDLNNEIAILIFLKTYQRTRSADQEELDDWLDRFPSSCMLPPISDWRLPYLPLRKDPWKFVKIELNLNTYELWLNVSDILKLSRESICSVAAINTINDEFSSADDSTNNSWNLNEQHASFLNKITHCLSYFSNPERNCAILYRTTNCFPPGADQVRAAEMCFSFAMAWSKEHELSEEAKVRIQKVKQKFHHLSAMHILHCHSLGEKELLRMVSMPHELLKTLYQHPGIVQRANNSKSFCPDINGAANKVAGFFEINIIFFWKELLRDLLMPENYLTAELLDCTTENALESQKNGVPENNFDDNLIRACYVLEADIENQLATYLVSIIYGTDAETARASRKLRTLQCLLSVLNISSLEMISGRDKESMKKLHLNLTFVSRLEAMGIQYSINAFEHSDKVAVIQNVWQKLSMNPSGLALLAQICLQYNIFNTKYWENLLKGMVKFQMVKELGILLPQLTQHVHMLSCSGLAQAWNLVIGHPFKKGYSPLSQENLRACIGSLIQLQSCPVVHSINIEDIIDDCLHINSVHMAASLLPYLQEGQEKYIRVIFQKCPELSSLTTGLNYLWNQGVLTVPEARTILNIS